MHRFTALNRWALSAFAVALIHGLACSAAGAVYDPLEVDRQFTPETLDLVVADADRDREIPILVYLPAQESPAPVVLFSHGLGGSRNGCAYLGKHWAARGYVAVFVQHPGSDVSVWKDLPRLERMSALRKAANAKNYLLRVRDIPAVLDQLETWHEGAEHKLAGRLDTDHVGMSGHSFGAQTTQGVSGQAIGRGFQPFTDPRIKAAIAFSPNSPKRAAPESAFGHVKIPWLLMTGTHDTAAIGDATMETRLAVFPALPPGNKYQVVLHLAEHSAFTERALPGDQQQRNPNHHRVILALSTAFWDAYLRDDTAARTWLDGDGPRAVMEKDDRWEKK
jgi:predicted dienelactone hydrolase